MSRKYLPKVITSNHLLEGDVIYFSKDGNWVRNIAEAAVFHDPETADARLAEADKQRNIHVGAYLADTRIDSEGRLEPVHFREQFRTLGPSNYFHGKQAGA